MDIPNEKITTTICPKCMNICNGKIVHDNNHITLKIYCPEHGDQNAILFENKNFYEDLKTLIKSNKKQLNYNFNSEFITFDRPEQMITSIHINFTEKCNLKCTNCFASCDPEKNKETNDIEIQEILNQLEVFRENKDKPMVVIIGGEPTTREELPLAIHEITSRGFNVRLSTNGIHLTDQVYMKNLINNGLNWLLLQFDGFNPETSIKFRRKNLVDIKQKVIFNAQKLGLKTHLIVMISKGVNSSEMLQILKFGFNEPMIYAVNFYPVSLTGRYGGQSTSVLDCIQDLEIQSKGNITYNDFIESKRLWNRLYKIFKRPILRQKICTYPMFFYRFKDEIFPINRLFEAKNIFKHPIFSLRYFIKCFKLLNWANKPTKDFLYFNMEKFYHSDAMDLKEAYDCHNVFLTSKGFIPFCIFNSIYRSKKCF